MGEVAYRSEVKVERVRGPLRRAWLPGAEEPILFGVHGAVAEHYGRAPGSYDSLPTTLDYVIAATAG